MLRKLIGITLIGVLSGCSLFSGDEDNAPKPVALVNIEKPAITIENQWSTSTGKGLGGEYLQLTAAYDDDALYTVDVSGRLVKTDLATGKAIYRKELKKSITAGVGLDQNKLYVSTEKGEVLALNAENGELLWQHALNNEILATPVASEGVVVIYGSDGSLYGLDAKDGSERWTYVGSTSNLTLRGSSVPTIQSGLIFLGKSNGRISIINLKTGQEQWEHTIAVGKGRSDLQRLVDINGRIAIDNNMLYVASYQGKITAVDGGTGRVNWQREMSAYRDLAVDYKAVYVSDAAGTIWALDKKTGYTLWKQDKFANRELSAPAVIGNHIVVGDLEGYLHVLSTEDGQAVGRTKIGSKAITAAPLVERKQLYVLSNDGNLAAVSLKNIS